MAQAQVILVVICLQQSLISLDRSQIPFFTWSSSWEYKLGGHLRQEGQVKKGHAVETSVHLIERDHFHFFHCNNWADFEKPHLEEKERVHMGGGNKNSM